VNGLPSSNDAPVTATSGTKSRTGDSINSSALPTSTTPIGAIPKRKSHWPEPLGPRHMVTVYRLPHRLRVALWGLVVAVLGLVVAVAVLFSYVLALKASRDARQATDQRNFETSMCRVLADLPANSPALDRVRQDLHCTQPGLPLKGNP